MPIPFLANVVSGHSSKDTFLLKNVVSSTYTKVTSLSLTPAKPSTSSITVWNQKCSYWSCSHLLCWKLWISWFSHKMSRFMKLGSGIGLLLVEEHKRMNSAEHTINLALTQVLVWVPYVPRELAVQMLAVCRAVSHFYSGVLVVVSICTGC